jgi:hypothetical protein
MMARLRGGHRTQLFVHLRRSDLDGKHGAVLEDGSVLSAETLRRLACDCSIVPVTVDDDGLPLDVGRKTRSIPPAIRRALRVRDRCCQFPGCDRDLFLDAHDVQSWAHGGETKLSNLLLLCTAHHRLLHEGEFRPEGGHEGEHERDYDRATERLDRFTVEPAAEGKGWVFRRPDGAILDPRPPPRPEVPPAPTPHERMAKLLDATGKLVITSDANYVFWDGVARELSTAIMVVMQATREKRWAKRRAQAEARARARAQADADADAA